MDEDPIQDALIVRMVAELMKGLATASEPEAGEGEKVSFAANPDAVSVPEQGLLGNESSTALQETGEPTKPASSTSATVSAAEPEAKRPAIFGDEAKPEIIEQALGLATEIQQPATPADVSVAKPDAKNEPQPDVVFPEPPPAVAALPTGLPDIEEIASTIPQQVKPLPLASDTGNTPAIAPPDSTNISPVVTLEPQKSESPQFPIIKNIVPSTSAVTLPETPALATQPESPLDTGKIVTTVSPPAEPQPFNSIIGSDLAATQPDSSNTSPVVTFGQSQAETPLFSVVENAAPPTPAVTIPETPALATRPPDAPAAEDIIATSHATAPPEGSLDTSSFLTFGQQPSKSPELATIENAPTPTPNVTPFELPPALATRPADAPAAEEFISTASPPVESQQLAPILENKPAVASPDLDSTGPIVTFESKRTETPQFPTFENAAPPTPNVTIPEPFSLTAQPTNPPAAEEVIATSPANAPPKDSLDTSSFFTFGQQPAKSPELATIENVAPPASAVTISEPPPALATQPTSPPDTGEIVTAASSPAGSQPFTLDAGSAPTTRPEGSPGTEAIFTFGQQQAESPLSQATENITAFGHPARPPGIEAFVAPASQRTESPPFILTSESTAEPAPPKKPPESIAEPQVVPPQNIPPAIAVANAKPPAFKPEKVVSEPAEAISSVAVGPGPEATPKPTTAAKRRGLGDWMERRRGPAQSAVANPEPVESPPAVSQAHAAAPEPPPAVTESRSVPGIAGDALESGHDPQLDEATEQPSINSLYLQAEAAGEIGSPPKSPRSPEKLSETIDYYRSLFDDTVARGKTIGFTGPPGSPKRAFYDAIAAERGGTIQWEGIGGDQFAGTFNPTVTNSESEKSIASAPAKPPGPPQPAVTPSVVSPESPQYAVSPAPDPNIAAEALDPNLELQDAFSPEPVPLDVFETQQNTAEQPQAINHDQGNSTPESALFSDIEYSQPAVQQFSDPTLDINQQLQQAAEQPRAAAQEIEDLQQVHKRFLDTHAEVIESLQATPRQFWTPKQRQQAEQIRQAKEAYKSRVLDVTQGPVQGAQPPSPPVPAVGSERTVETQDLFAAKRPAAQPPKLWHAGGVPTKQPAHLAALQATGDAAAPADLGGLGGPEDLPPESPPQVALDAIPEEYRGNLASDALSIRGGTEGITTWSELRRLDLLGQAGYAAAPESEAEAMPTSIWAKMARQAKQVFQQTLHPPTTPFATRPRRLDPASFSEGSKERPRSVFDQPDEEEPLSSLPDDDDFWSALPPVTTGAPRRKDQAGRGNIFDALAGGQGDSQGGSRGGSQDVMHVWVDGGQLELVDHINTLGSINGRTSTKPQSAGGQQQQGEGQSSDIDQLFSLQNLLAGGAFTMLARNAILGGLRGAGGDVVSGIASDAMNLAGQVPAATAAGAQVGFQAGGPIGALAGAAGGAVAGMESAIIQLPDHILEWDKALVESREGLARWSGTLQEVFWVSKQREYLREQASATTTGAATQGLNENWQNLLDEIRPMKDEIYKGTALIANFATQILTTLASIDKASNGMLLDFVPFVGILRRLGQIADHYFPPQKSNALHVRWMQNWQLPLSLPGAPPVGP